MSRCLACLAREYPSVKFCEIDASDANMSEQFVRSAVPALLVYKSRQVIGNFVRLADEFDGDKFYADDVESFLVE